MLTRTPIAFWNAAPPTEASRAAFAAEVEKILAECRRRRLADERAAFWDRATADLTDEQYDHNREAWRNGEGEV